MDRIFLPIIIVGVSVGVFVYSIKPQYTDTKSLLNKKSQYDEALIKTKDLIASRDALLSRYNTFSSDDLSSLDKLLPDTADNVKLLMDISGVASKYGMILKEVSIETSSGDNKKTEILEIEEKKYGTINLKFSVTASYETFLSFIRELEENRRISDIYSLSFKSTDTGLYQYNLALRIYWLK